jgi:hypothetical protein
MTASTKPKPPTGLKPRGRGFWNDVTGAFDLAPVELQLLAEACRTADECERLAGDTNPKAVTELRLQRLLLGRLIAQLDIPESDIAAGTTIRGRKGADARWKGHVPGGGVEVG